MCFLIYLGHRQVIDAIKLGLKPSFILYTERAIFSANDSSSTRDIKSELFDVINDSSINRIDSQHHGSDTASIQEVSEEIMKSITDTVSNQGIYDNKPFCCLLLYYCTHL